MRKISIFMTLILVFTVLFSSFAFAYETDNNTLENDFIVNSFVSMNESGDINITNMETDDNGTLSMTMDFNGVENTIQVDNLKGNKVRYTCTEGQKKDTIIVDQYGNITLDGSPVKITATSDSKDLTTSSVVSPMATVYRHSDTPMLGEDSDYSVDAGTKKVNIDLQKSLINYSTSALQTLFLAAIKLTGVVPSLILAGLVEAISYYQAHYGTALSLNYKDHKYNIDPSSGLMNYPFHSKHVYTYTNNKYKSIGVDDTIDFIDMAVQ